MEKNKENSIKIDIQSQYVPELSNNEDSLFYFSYQVTTGLYVDTPLFLASQ